MARPVATACMSAVAARSLGTHLPIPIATGSLAASQKSLRKAVQHERAAHTWPLEYSPRIIRRKDEGSFPQGQVHQEAVLPDRDCSSSHRRCSRPCQCEVDCGGPRNAESPAHHRRDHDPRRPRPRGDVRRDSGHLPRCAGQSYRGCSMSQPTPQPNTKPAHKRCGSCGAPVHKTPAEGEGLPCGH